MRLTIVNLFYPPDLAPSAHFAASLAAHRAALGDRVTVITGRGSYLGGRSPDGEAPMSPPSTGPHVIRLWTPALGKQTLGHRLSDYGAFLVGAVWRLLRLPAQDVVIVMTTPPYLEIVAVAHRLLHARTRIVAWTHDLYPDAAEEYGAIRRGGPMSRLLRASKRWLFRRVDHVVALDSAMRDRALSQYADDGRPTGSVIPNWEPIALFPAGIERRGDRVRPAVEPFAVLYLGNLSYGHPIDTIVRAAEALRDEPFAFTFVGGGTRFPELRERTAHLANVTIHDYVPKAQTPSVLSRADCSLVSLDDGSLGIMSPCKVHASLAMGVPVVYLGPRGTNVDEAIASFGCGSSLRHGDVDGLVGALRRLREDADVAGEMSRNARRAFDEAYADVRTLPRFDELLAELTSRPV